MTTRHLDNVLDARAAVDRNDRSAEVDTTTEDELTSAAAGGACEAIIAWLGIECGDPSVGLYRRICVHEHVIDGRLCQVHIDDVAFGRCRVCFELSGDLSHDCPINLAEVAE